MSAQKLGRQMLKTLLVDYPKGNATRAEALNAIGALRELLASLEALLRKEPAPVGKDWN
jgi:hypothetical protein